MPSYGDAREVAGRLILARLGILVSPEFGAALFAVCREKLVTGGWQAGKSFLSAASILIELPRWVRNKRDFRYWLIVPSYETPTTEMRYLRDWLRQLGILSSAHFPEKGAAKLTALGGRIVIETKTGQNLAGIAGEPCDGVIVVEAGQQSAGVQEAALGRVMTRRGWILYSGTLEDDEGTPRWAWYAEVATDWITHGPGANERAFSLPSWANRTVYPGGEHDPEIVRLRVRLDPYTFDRRIAAKPTGVQNQAYPQTTFKQLLLPIPTIECARCHGKGCKACNAGKVYGYRGMAWEWVGGAGGVDFGSGFENHPSVISGGTLNQLDQLWIRRCEWVKTGDAGDIANARALIRDLYNVWQWATDPNEKWGASTLGEGTIAVKGAAGAREGRISMTRRRLNLSTPEDLTTPGGLYFDLDGEGVAEAYYQMTRFHYVKNAQGALIPWRVDDDGPASIEDLIEVLDGTPGALADLGGMSHREKAKPAKARRVSRPPMVTTQGNRAAGDVLRRSGQKALQRGLPARRK